MMLVVMVVMMVMMNYDAGCDDRDDGYYAELQYDQHCNYAMVYHGF